MGFCVPLRKPPKGSILLFWTRFGIGRSEKTIGLVDDVEDDDGDLYSDGNIDPHRWVIDKVERKPRPVEVVALLIFSVA